MSRSVLAWLVLVVFALGASEALLRLAAWGLSPRPPTGAAPQPLSLPDERLGVRPNPLFPGHDARGFRNPSALDAAEIVALGDSQTYGVGVPPEQIWPMQLQQLTGRTTYGMAFGGWGPVQSLALLDQALALHPSVVIEALYAGNDVYDSFTAAYSQGQRSGLTLANAAAVAEAERQQSLAAKAGALFQQLQEPDIEPASNWSRRLDDLSLVWRTVDQLRLKAQARWQVYQLRDLDPEKRSAVLTERWARSRGALALDGEGLQTILTPEYRLAGLDLSDVRLLEGERITLECIEQMADRTERSGAQFMVLLLPTKELVFSEVARDLDVSSPAYQALVQNEVRFWDTVKARLSARRIPFVEVLPDLREALRERRQPYPASWDGHPNAEGHRAIATAVSRATR